MFGQVPAVFVWCVCLVVVQRCQSEMLEDMNDVEMVRDPEVRARRGMEDVAPYLTDLPQVSKMDKYVALWQKRMGSGPLIIPRMRMGRALAIRAAKRGIPIPRFGRTAGMKRGRPGHVVILPPRPGRSQARLVITPQRLGRGDFKVPHRVILPPRVGRRAA